MNQDLTEALAPELCAGKIFEISGAKLDPDTAADLWPKILPHKWLMSEKLGRDVGLRVACIDFLENIEQAREEYLAYKQRDILNEMGAQTISKELWDTISDSQPPKQIVQSKILLPLTKQDLSKKHGVVHPKTIIFFGPPGTGKTHFARAIAEDLQPKLTPPQVKEKINLAPKSTLGGSKPRPPYQSHISSRSGDSPFLPLIFL